MRLSSDEVAQFLKDHPEFFDEYAEMVIQVALAAAAAAAAAAAVVVVAVALAG